MFKKHQKASNSLKRLEFRLFLTSTVGLISMDRWTENCCSCRSRREKSLKQPCLKIHIWSIVIPSKDGWTADANLAHLNHVSAKPMGLQCSIVMQSLYSYCIVSSCFIAYVWHCLQRTSSSLSSNCRRTVVFVWLPRYAVLISAHAFHSIFTPRSGRSTVPLGTSPSLSLRIRRSRPAVAQRLCQIWEITERF